LGCQRPKIFLIRIIWNHSLVAFWWASQQVNPLLKMPSLLLVSAKLNFFLKMLANLSGPLLPNFRLAMGHHHIPWYETCHFSHGYSERWLWTIFHLLRCQGTPLGSLSPVLQNDSGWWFWHNPMDFLKEL
jgi:hypothetical protein